MSAHVLFNLLNMLGERDKMRGLPSHCKLSFYTKCTAQDPVQARDGPKPIIFLQPSAESGRLSSDSLSPGSRSLALLCVHADHFINGCANGSIGFIILDMACEYIFMYICCVCY